MTKNIKLTNWFIIIFSSIVISAILWNTYVFVQNFKNEERNKMELWSLATLELVSAEGEISNLTLEVLKKNTTTPMIKIDSGGSIEINNIPDLDINDTIQINKLVNKFKSEKKFLRLVQTNHFIKIARCFTFIGKHIPKNETYAMGNFLSHVEKNKSINIEATNSKHTFRSYLDSKKLVNSLMLMLVYKKKISFPIFNIGSKNEISIFNLAKLFENLFKVKVSTPSKMTKDVDYYVPNTNKFSRYFNKKLSTNLKNQLKQIFID